MVQTRQYKVLSILGQGGFGTVYRARLTGEGGFSKPVALKVLNPGHSSTGELARRLRDEARVLGLVQHRAIVKVDALVPLNGRWTVVMEYVEGRDLKTILEQGPIPLGAALEIGAEIAGALHAAWHATGADGAPLHLLHRDIKPANVCVTALGEVKVLDFGIARAEFTDREAHTASQAFGTPDYMAPERFLFENGPESDIYALAVTLYEMLLGRPFGRASANQKMHDELVAGRLEPLRAALGPAHEDTVELVAELLTYEPAARPSAREVERRLTRMRHTKGGALLRDWAEGVLPPLVAAQEQRVDGSTGTQLVEGAEPAPGAGRAALAWPIDEVDNGSSTFALSHTPPGGGPTLVASAAEDTGSSEVVPAPPPGTVSGRRVAAVLVIGALVLGLSAIYVKSTGTTEFKTSEAKLNSLVAPPPGSPPAEAPAPAEAAPAAPPETSPPVEAGPAAPPAAAPAPKPTPPSAQPRAAAPSAGAARAGAGVTGTWEGTLGGQPVDLTLRGDPASLRGRVVVYRGASSVGTDVKGSYNPESRALTLVDVGDEPDASAYALELSEDGAKLSGAATPVGTETRVRLILSRSGS